MRFFAIHGTQRSLCASESFSSLLFGWAWLSAGLRCRRDSLQPGHVWHAAVDRSPARLLGTHWYLQSGRSAGLCLQVRFMRFATAVWLAAPCAYCVVHVLASTELLDTLRPLIIQAMG